MSQFDMLYLTVRYASDQINYRIEHASLNYDLELAFYEQRRWEEIKIKKDLLMTQGMDEMQASLIAEESFKTNPTVGMVQMAVYQ